MARITGIGGVFLRSQDSKALAKWYADHLGLTLTDFGGATFLWSDEVPAGTGMTTWSSFPANTTYFADGPQAAMINYRVDDLDELLAQLRAAGVQIVKGPDADDTGKFAWIMDPDENKLELWEPKAEEGTGA